MPAIDVFARRLVQQLPRNLVVGLSGTLGAGKTTFVQAIARAAQIDVAEVTSPTFTLLQSHQGSIVLHHMDAYRVNDEDEFLELGVEELFEQSDAWTLVEWAERVADVMPANTLWLRIELTGTDDRRNVVANCRDVAVVASLSELAKEWK